jgi:hypothetical protein
MSNVFLKLTYYNATDESFYLNVNSIVSFRGVAEGTEIVVLDSTYWVKENPEHICQLLTESYFTVKSLTMGPGEDFSS